MKSFHGDWEEVDRLWGEILPILAEKLVGNFKFLENGLSEKSERPALEEAVDARRHRRETFWAYMRCAGFEIKVSRREIQATAASKINMMTIFKLDDFVRDFKIKPIMAGGKVVGCLPIPRRF